jgi:hypothetical protein
MYVATGVLFLIPCTLLLLATKNLFRTDGTVPPLRRYLSGAAVLLAGVSTIMHIVWNASWLHAGGSPHGMRAGPGIWEPLGPILARTFAITIVLSLFGKGKVRMLLLGWTVSMVVVFYAIYMFQMD